MLRAKQLRSRLATHFPCHTPRSQAPYPGVIGPSRETPVSAPGTPEAAPEFGGSGRHSRWWARAALRGLAPKCAASSSSQPGWCPSSPAEGAERRRRPPTSPLLLSVPSLHFIRPMHFVSASVAALTPLLVHGCAALGPPQPKERGDPLERRCAHTLGWITS